MNCIFVFDKKLMYLFFTYNLSDGLPAVRSPVVWRIGFGSNVRTRYFLALRSALRFSFSALLSLGLAAVSFGFGKTPPCSDKSISLCQA